MNIENVKEMLGDSWHDYGNDYDFRPSSFYSDQLHNNNHIRETLYDGSLTNTNHKYTLSHNGKVVINIKMSSKKVVFENFMLQIRPIGFMYRDMYEVKKLIYVPLKDIKNMHIEGSMLKIYLKPDKDVEKNFEHMGF